MSDDIEFGSYNVAELAAADDVRRERDIADLRSGRRSVAEVRDQNGALLRSLGKPSIDFGRARLS